MRQSTGSLLFGGVLGFVTACNSLDSEPQQVGTRTIVPVDARATQQALTPPPAISGGTLAITFDGLYAIAAGSGPRSCPMYRTRDWRGETGRP